MHTPAIHRAIRLLLLLGALRSAVACTAFMLDIDGRPVVGKNYDWGVEHGYVLVNKRGVGKRAFAAENPVRWVSRYGSVSFNQYGQELPCGGMNEAGLAIEALWLDETRYPLGDPAPEIDNMQYVQYHLDMSATVKEVIANDRNLTISPVTPTATHYFIADRQGNTLVVEALDSQMHHFLPGPKDPPVLSNDPYERSVRLVRKCRAFGGELEVPDGPGSVSRFIRAASFVREHQRGGSDPVESAYRILESVTVPILTKWSIVYDIDSLTVFFRSSSRRRRKSLSFSQLDFACATPTRGIAIRTRRGGDVGERLAVFGSAHQQQLLQKAIRRTPFLRFLPESLIQSLVQYQRSLRCAE